MNYNETDMYDVSANYDSAESRGASMDSTSRQTYSDGQNRCRRCNRPLSNPTQAYGWYCAKLLGLDPFSDTSTEMEARSLTGEDSALKLDNLALRAYNAYKERYLSEDTELAEVAWGDSISDWFAERWNQVKWAFETVGNYASKAQKKAQRSVWAFGAEYYLRRVEGHLTSAWMLEHSLQDNPEDIWRGNDSRIAYLINNDKKFSEEVEAAIQNSDGKRLQNKHIGVEFSTGDLLYSIHKGDIYLNGHRQDNGRWIIHCNLYDTYDFTEIMTLMDGKGGWSKNFGKATLANDAAVISQKTGAINPYRIEVDFWITR